MTTVAHCGTLDEAQRIRTRLDAAGIPASIPDEFAAGAWPFHLTTPSGIRVQVADADAAAAAELLKSEDQD